MKPKQNHCYGHTPQIQKGAKTSNSGVERNAIRFKIYIHIMAGGGGGGGGGVIS